MSENLTKFLNALALLLVDLRDKGEQITFENLLLAIGTARYKAAQPEPGAVPVLPEWVEFAGADAGWRIGLEGPPGRNAWLETSWCESPDDLDRIAEACTKLAARERARRAGS